MHRGTIQKHRRENAGCIMKRFSLINKIKTHVPLEFIPTSTNMSKAAKIMTSYASFL